MVGVAGKSKGCNTCRKRKIACGQQRPVCTQCTRSKRTCAGYERDRVFVLVNPNNEKTHIFVRPDSDSTPSSESYSSPEDTIFESRHRDRSSSSSSSEVTERFNWDADISFPETTNAYTVLQNRIDRHNLLQAFLCKCFPSGWASRAPRSWLPLLNELPITSNSHVLETSSLALAASVIGRDRQDDSLINIGLKAYTQGLRQLRKALRHPVLMKEDGTLAACMALSLYETMECPSKGTHGSFSHSAGLLALIEARGVERHLSGAGHRLFLGIRVPGVLHVLNNGASSDILDSTWIEGPWVELPKTHLDRVTDCLFAAPGILNRVPLLQHLNQFERAELIYKLVEECWLVNEKLDTVYSEIQSVSSGPIYTIVPSRVNPLADTKTGECLFPVAFGFPDSTTASTLSLLWATRAMLWSGLCGLYMHYYGCYSTASDSNPQSMTDASHSVKALPELGQCRDYLTMAHNVCQSIEYFLQDEMGLIGAISVTPAIGLAIEALQNWPGHEREIDWLLSALRLVRGRGVRVLEYAGPN